MSRIVAVDGSYQKVKIQGSRVGSYEAALVLSDRRQRDPEEIQIESQRPWVEPTRVSEMVVRRRLR